MARSGVLLALTVLAAAACAQARGMMTGSGMMSGKSSGGGGGSGGSDNAVFSRGRATSGDAYLAACAPGFRSEMPAWLAPADTDAMTTPRRDRYTVQFDTPPAQLDGDKFRSTVAGFFKARASMRGGMQTRR